MKYALVILLVLIGVGVLFFQTSQENVVEMKTSLPEVISTGVSHEQSLDFQDYNYQFVDTREIEKILDELIGDQGTVAFYLPPTGYINASRGSSFGVAFALNNPQPSGENYFEYEFVADASVVESCGVSVKEATSWITMGFKSFGKIPQGWIDKMTVFFEFPGNIEPCTAKYNFEVTKDGQRYGEQQLVFNLQ